MIQLGSGDEPVLFGAVEHVQDSTLEPHQIGSNSISLYPDRLKGPNLVPQRPHVRSGQQDAKPLVQAVSEVLAVMGIDDSEHHDSLALHHETQRMKQGHTVDHGQAPGQELHEAVKSTVPLPGDGEEQEDEGVNGEDGDHVKLL
jgi:hypothetical protein